MEYRKARYALEKPVVKSMKQAAYEAIGGLILSGGVQAGERLVETELSKQLNISRGPIREALMRLEQEGLVCSSPYRGTTVAEISPKETREVYIPIRKIVERYACRQAHAMLSSEDYARLGALVESLRAACAARDAQAVAELDAQFHGIVVDRCAGPTLRAIWRSLFARISLQIYAQTKLADITAAIADEHSGLLECMRTGDMARLHALLDEHIL